MVKYQMISNVILVRRSSEQSAYLNFQNCYFGFVPKTCRKLP